MDEWHYARAGGKPAGPVTYDELRRLSAAGELAADDLVWKAGSPAWVAAGSVAGLATAAPIEYAGFGVRAAARAVDSLACVLLGFAGGLFGGIALAVLQAAGRAPADWSARLRAQSPVVVLFSVASMCLYHAACEGLCGATPGKFVCGLRVVSADGGPARLGGALIRTLGFYLDSLFFGLVAYSKMSKSPLRQRYGDGWAGTAVAYARSLPESSKRSGWDFVVAGLVGVGGAAALDAASLLAKVFWTR